MKVVMRREEVVEIKEEMILLPLTTKLDQNATVVIQSMKRKRKLNQLRHGRSGKDWVCQQTTKKNV